MWQRELLRSIANVWICIADFFLIILALWQHNKNKFHIFATAEIQNVSLVQTVTHRNGQAHSHIRNLAELTIIVMNVYTSTPFGRAIIVMGLWTRRLRKRWDLKQNFSFWPCIAGRPNDAAMRRKMRQAKYHCEMMR